MYAARYGHTDVIQMLHDFETDVNHQDKVNCYCAHIIEEMLH